MSYFLVLTHYSYLFTAWGTRTRTDDILHNTSLTYDKINLRNIKKIFNTKYEYCTVISK